MDHPPLFSHLRLRNSFTRLIARAEKESPYLAQYIRRNLYTDNGFTWLGVRRLNR